MPPWRAAGNRPAASPPQALTLAEVKSPPTSPATYAPAKPAAAPATPPPRPSATPEGDADDETPAIATPPEASGGADPTDHPLVKQAMELFKARIVDVQPKRD